MLKTNQWRLFISQNLDTKMNTEQLKQINTHLALIEAELGRIRATIQESSVPMPDGITGNSSDSPYVKSEQPNLYAVDWTNAPDWADVHCFDSRGIGHWIGMSDIGKAWESLGRISGHNLPDGLDWKLSKTFRPR